MWNKKTKKTNQNPFFNFWLLHKKKKLGVKHLVSFTEWKCTYKIHKLLISTYKCVYETICRLHPLYHKAQLGCTLGFWLGWNTHWALLNKWWNMKSDPNHMCAELQKVFWGILTQILRFTLNHQRRVYNTIQSSSISAASEAETALRAWLQRLFKYGV